MERIINFGKSSSLSGILSYSETSKPKFCIVYLNAGIVHKVGPNCIYVNLSRNLCMEGIWGFRFDYSGLGDNINEGDDTSSEDKKLSEIEQSIDTINKETGISKFIIIALCSSSSVALDAFKLIKAVKGAVIIDGLFLGNSGGKELIMEAIKRCRIRYYKKSLKSVIRWKKLITGKSKVLNKKSIHVIINLFYEKLSHRFRTTTKTKDVDAINQSARPILKWGEIVTDKKVYLIFTEGGYMYDLYNLSLKKGLIAKSSNNNYKMEFIKNIDHTFTPKWSQEELISKIKFWLKNEIF